MVFMDDPLSKKVKDPRDFRYMKLFRFTMRLMGTWPGRVLNEGTTIYETGPLILVVLLKISTLCLTIIYLIENTHRLSFFETGHIYITIFMTLVTLSRGFTLPLNPKFHRVMVKYITKMHLFYYKDSSDIAMQTHIKVHKLSHFFAIFLKIQLVMGSSMFNIIPIYNNYKAGKFQDNALVNGTYELSIYYKIPPNLLNSMDGYILITVFNWYSSYICSNFFCMFDLALSLVIFTVSGHFKILIYNLNNFPPPATATGSHKLSSADELLHRAHLYTDEENKSITYRLNRCIDYHRELIEFTEDISDAFGPMLFVYYIFHQVSGCLLLLECSQLDAQALMCYGILTVVLFQQLIQLSVVVESVGTVTGYLKDAVYNVPWQYMDVKNRKTTCTFLMNVQEPVHINALGLAKVGVQPMAGILKTSFSYFAFLRTVSE